MVLVGISLFCDITNIIISGNMSTAGVLHKYTKCIVSIRLCFFLFSLREWVVGSTMLYFPYSAEALWGEGCEGTNVQMM